MSKRPGEELQGPAPTRVARENGQEDARLAIKRKEQRIIMYRDTEPLAGIANIWNNNGGEEVSVEVVISPEYLSKDNKRVRSRQFWGDLVYTHDSDLVAVLMHLGYYAHNLQSPPQAVVEARAVIKLVPSAPLFPSKQRFTKSRAWNRPSEVCAYQVEQCWLVTRNAKVVHLQPSVDDLPVPAPTVQPQASDRQMSTRTAGSKGRANQEIKVQYNLSQEPWLKYTLATVADKGLKSGQLTSARLMDNVLFLETASHRYQIARLSSEEGSPELYSFSVCKVPKPASVMQKVGLPLPASEVDIIETNLDWEEFAWGISMLHVRGKEYVLRRICLMRTVKGQEGTS